jgi:hypothetical protein
MVDFSFLLSFLNYLAIATAAWNICFLYVLGQSGADVLRNPSYISLQLSSAATVQCAGLHFQQMF